MHHYKSLITKKNPMGVTVLYLYLYYNNPHLHFFLESTLIDFASSYCLLSYRSSSPATYQCPQQPKLKVPLSRLSDGICDCCDGSDEPQGVCQDICEQVLKEEREAQARREQAFALGYNKRKHELYNFKKLREEKIKEIEDLEQQKETLDPTVPWQQAQDLQLAYLSQRMALTDALLQASAKTEPTDILAALTSMELRTVIILACQIAGEMAVDEDTTTCVPLRLAGLEMGMTWPEDNYEQVGQLQAQILDNVTSSVPLATRLFTNAAQAQRKWTLENEKGTNKDGRRRLEEEVHMYDDDELHDYDGHYDDDDYHGRDDFDHHDPPKEEPTGPLDTLSGLQKELVDGIKALPFSATRNAFLNRSDEILAQISTLLANNQKSQEQENDDKPVEAETEKEAEIEKPDTASVVDPVAYNMLRNTLTRKTANIVKGFKWGASSMLFFAANSELTEDQRVRLAMYTIYHGNLSALQVWQILQVALDDFLVPPTIDSETCASPWAGSCPPKTITRQGVTVPASTLIQVAERFCSEQSQTAMESCAPKAIDANGIPTVIPEGFYGYSTPVPRDEKDPVAAMFAPLTALPVDKEGLENLEKEEDRLERERKNLDRKITDLWKDIGGKTGEEMGPNGELHSMANKCFEVEAGKYTYEVCVFGQAKQKEGSGGGTGLGKYTRMDRDEETGQRVLYWENGQKCWNGPNRSATVYLTCGSENKVLSADEPDTCRYVLQMESYIACDEDYKQRMGL